MCDFFSIALISLRDMRHEFLLSLLAILGLAGILAPLLILFSLQYGLVASMGERLLSAPEYREIKINKIKKTPTSWFYKIRKRADVEFIVPLPFALSIGKGVSLTNSYDYSSQTARVDVLSTMYGDPVLARWHYNVEGSDQAVLSYYPARELGLLDSGNILLEEYRSGRKKVEVHILRRSGKEQQREEIRLFHIIGVLPKEASDRNHNVLYADLSFLTALDDFKMGMRPEMSFEQLLGQDLSERCYPGFRLYARKLGDVKGLVNYLEEEGYKVSSYKKRISEMQQLDLLLKLIFIAVAGIGALGFLLANMVNLMANVAKKQRDLSILRLLGYSSWAIAFFPAVQAVITAIMGCTFAYGIYLFLAPVIEVHFFSEALMELFNDRIVMEQGASLMRLYPEHLFIATGVTVVVSLLASTAAGIRAARLIPSEGIRYD